jgi:hypothetical protein
MTKSLGFAALALMLGGCVYSPTPGPSMAPVAGGYTLNDNGYQTYYATKPYPIPDCKNDATWRCRDRLAYDDEFCAEWDKSGRCGDSAVTSEPSRDVSAPPPSGRGWFW